MIFVSTLSNAERQALKAMTRQAVGRVAERAWYVLWSAEQVSVPEIAARMQCKPKTVRKWLRRFQAVGSDGLQDRPRSGRPTHRSPGLEQAVWMQVHQPPWTFGYVFAIWTVKTLCQHLVTRCRQQASPWLVRQLLRSLRYRFRRPKVAPRGVDPERDAIHQQIGRKIAQAVAGTVVLVEDETDIRLFPILRQMWMRMGEQLELPAPLTNQKRTIFGALELFTGEVFYRQVPRQRTVEMITFLEALCEHYAERPILLKGSAAANRCCRSMEELITVVTRYLDSLTPERVFQLVA